MNDRQPVTPPRSLSKFRAAYLDYREGDCDEPPSLDGLSDRDRRVAASFVESSEVAAGIDPYASRPSVEKLLAGIERARSSEAASEAPLGSSELRDRADPTRPQ